MPSRDAILARIRRSLGVSARDATRLAAVSGRLAAHPSGVIPARAQLAGEARIALFVARAEAVCATVTRLAGAEEIPQAVAASLAARNLPPAVRRGEDRRLAALSWDSALALAVSVGPSGGEDLAAVSHADAGVAETGTLVLTSGPDNPSTLNFLPDHHIVVVAAADIVGDDESVWALMRDRFGEGQLPRTVDMITGPSRSADIEETLLLGAHGPRSLHILVVG